MRYSRFRRTDANHKAVAEVFGKAGWLVHHTLADWDMTIAKGAIVLLIEVKDGSKSPSRRKNTGNEQKLIDAGWPIFTVQGVDEALRVAQGP